jgi:hypothetical protein
MPFVSIFERMAKEEGQREELLAGLELALELKFGEAGRSFCLELKAITDIIKLKEVQRAIRTATSLDELRGLV